MVKVEPRSRFEEGPEPRFPALMVVDILSSSSASSVMVLSMTEVLPGPSGMVV
jgi:hypothetical protein